MTLKALNRLLPGDRAPDLPLARVFNRSRQEKHVIFDRLSAIVLWNAGCAGCLPAVNQVAELGEPHGMPCYGVAVMVRDVGRTAEAAAKGSPKAILGLEERPEKSSGMARGKVTRNWLEASGQQGVPTGFLVDGKGVVLWMGDPDEIREILPSVVAGAWDVVSARRHWLGTVSNDAIAVLRVVRDVTDALVAGDVGAASAALAAGERHTPSVECDPEFNILKLRILAMAAERDKAQAHYARASALVPGDARAQASLANIVLKAFPDDKQIAARVLDELSRVGDAPVNDLHAAASSMTCRLQQAEAEILLGMSAAAVASIERADALASAMKLPPDAQAWAADRINELRGRIQD